MGCILAARASGMGGCTKLGLIFCWSSYITRCSASSPSKNDKHQEFAKKCSRQVESVSVFLAEDVAGARRLRFSCGSRARLPHFEWDVLVCGGLGTVDCVWDH